MEYQDIDIVAARSIVEAAKMKLTIAGDNEEEKLNSVVERINRTARAMRAVSKIRGLIKEKPRVSTVKKLAASWQAGLDGLISVIEEGPALKRLSPGTRLLLPELADHFVGRQSGLPTALAHLAGTLANKSIDFEAFCLCTSFNVSLIESVTEPVFNGTYDELTDWVLEEQATEVLAKTDTGGDGSAEEDRADPRFLMISGRGVINEVGTGNDIAGLPDRDAEPGSGGSGVRPGKRPFHKSFQTTFSQLAAMVSARNSMESNEEEGADFDVGYTDRSADINLYRLNLLNAAFASESPETLFVSPFDQATLVATLKYWHLFLGSFVQEQERKLHAAQNHLKTESRTEYSEIVRKGTFAIKVILANGQERLFILPGENALVTGRLCRVLCQRLFGGLKLNWVSDGQDDDGQGSDKEIREGGYSRFMMALCDCWQIDFPLNKKSGRINTDTSRNEYGKHKAKIRDGSDIDWRAKGEGDKEGFYEDGNLIDWSKQMGRKTDSHLSHLRHLRQAELALNNTEFDAGEWANEMIFDETVFAQLPDDDSVVNHVTFISLMK